MSTKNQIVIQSEGLGAFRLGPRHGEYLDLEVERQSLRATTRIYLYDDNISLLQFFEELSQNWQGWNGLKSWTSLEGDLKVSSSIDSLGHVSFALDVTNNSMSPSWSVKTTLTIDAGSLEKLAQQARALLT